MSTIGVDLGGTKIEIASVSDTGVIEERITLATDVKGGYHTILTQISEAVRSLSKMGRGIGVGVPGQVDKLTGVIHEAPNLHWKEVPFQQDLEKYLQLPVTVINDVRAATLGEWRFGAARGLSDVLCLFVGTGIGGGIIANNQLLSGATNCAGEFGHTLIGTERRLCRCGALGCLEAVAGGRAIADRTYEAIHQHPTLAKTILHCAAGGEITARTVALAYSQGDLLAKELMAVTEEALIEGCINLVHSFNPSHLILGGGIITGFPFLLPAIDRGIKERGLKAATRHLQVVPAALGGDAGVIGAAITHLA